MALKAEASLTVALATGTLVYAIFQNATPTIADQRSVDQFNADLESAERQASWTAAAAVAGISLISRDPNPFIFGGAMVIVLAWAHRHADMVNPLTGKASVERREPHGAQVPPALADRRRAMRQAEARPRPWRRGRAHRLQRRLAGRAAARRRLVVVDRRAGNGQGRRAPRRDER